MLFFSKFISGKLANALTLLVLPYLLIITINNYFIVKMGFDPVNNSTLEFLLITFFIFELGCIFSKLFTVVSIADKSISSVKSGIQIYNMKRMITYVIIVIFLSFMRLGLAILKHGISYIGSEEFSGFLINGLVGKMLLSCFPLVPIILFEWFNRKKDIYLLLIVVGVFLLSFLTFVKYHVISLVIITFFFLYMKDKKFLKLGVISLAIFVPAMFILNYVISFKVRGIAVNNDFYLMHFWNYVGGSLINDNNALSVGFGRDSSILFKIGVALFPILNMILSPLGLQTPFVYDILPFSQIGITSDFTTNVIDSFAYFYDSSGDIDRKVIFLLLVFLLGLISALVVNVLTNSKKDNILLVASSFATFFLILSFFGTFYVNPVPWLWMLFAYIMPKLFKNKRA